jgi:hypothetical protein
MGRQLLHGEARANACESLGKLQENSVLLPVRVVLVMVASLPKGGLLAYRKKAADDFVVDWDE